MRKNNWFQKFRNHTYVYLLVTEDVITKGINAKYLTYTFLEHSINKIVAMSVTQFTECGNSNRMEKYGFQKVLHGMEARDLNIKQITTGMCK